MHECDESSMEGVERLLSYAEGLSSFRLRRRRPRVSYCHMGATICDAGLQAGLNYRNVVAPRVGRVLELWPSASTTSGFLAKSDRYGLFDVLAWRNSEKPNRIVEIARFCQKRGLETEDDLRKWLCQGGAELLEIRGVGPKTIDYLMILVGLPAVAVDRHARVFLSQAGVEAATYDQCRKILCATAEVLEIHPAILDEAIWQFVSTLRTGPDQSARLGAARIASSPRLK